MFDTVEELDTYCRSRTDEDISDGHPGAAEHTGPGPHPTVVFTRTSYSDAHLSGYRLEDFGPYEEWLPASPEQAVLLACVHGGTPGLESVGTCEYEPSLMTGVRTGDPFELPLHELPYTFTVYALKTGEEIATGEIPPKNHDCPATVRSDSPVRELSKAYTNMDSGAVHRAIEEAVTADAP